jgi:peptide/nickel transport system substrate-binding protein
LTPNPLRDLKVRKAMSMALDRRALVERVMEGAAIQASQALPDGFSGVSPQLKPEPFDLAGARKLLADAGHAEGFELTLHGPNDRYVNDAQTLQAVAQMLSRLGLKVKVEVMPRAIYFPKSRGFEFSAGLWGYSTDTGEVGSWLYNVLGCVDPQAGRGSANVGRYCNARLDAVVAEALSAPDAAKRETLLRQASEIAIGDVAIIPMFYLVNVWASKADLAYKPRTDEYTLANDVIAAK